jgi:hypothetical protein
LLYKPAIDAKPPRNGGECAFVLGDEDAFVSTGQFDESSVHQADVGDKRSQSLLGGNLKQLNQALIQRPVPEQMDTRLPEDLARGTIETQPALFQVVPYSELPEKQKDKDRRTIENYPKYTRAAGFKIVAQREAPTPPVPPAAPSPPGRLESRGRH